MFTGKNNSGKLFDVLNEDREVIGSFDTIGDAVVCGRAAHWTQGECNIRRDRAMHDAAHASIMAAQKTRMADFYLTYC